MKDNVRMFYLRFALLLSAFVFASKGLALESAQENQSSLTIAVASNFYFPLSTLIKQSEYWNEQNIRLVSASSGTLYAQVTKGAPFDLLFSADTERPARLEKKSLGISRQTYAQGKLVLWPIPSNFSAESNAYKVFEVNGKLAIANPSLAPFGLAAKAYIETLDNRETLLEKLVLGASATQAFQFVDSGNAEFGLLAESTLVQAKLTLTDNKYLHYMLIPIESYPAINQQVVIISRSENKVFAQQFIDFVLSPSSQRDLSALGYNPVSEPTL
jgi:molybdate transport system substrate-binding protein